MTNNRTFLTWKNNGKNLVATNFWRSRWNKHGQVFLCGHAGAIRLLLPTGFNDPVSEINMNFLSAKEVLITKNWSKYDRQELVEVKFVTSDPHPPGFMFTMDNTHSIRKNHTRKPFDFLIYTRGCTLAAKLQGKWAEWEVGPFF